MQLLDDHMFRLWKQGVVEKRDILIKANSPDELTNRIAQAERGMFEDEDEAREPGRQGVIMAIRRIGQILVDLGFLREEQLEMLLEEQQQRPGEMLGQIAMSMGLVTDDQLAQALAEQMGMQVVSLSDVVIPPEVLTHITEPMAQLYRIIPLSFEDNTLTIAMCDPQKLSIIDELRSFLGFDIKAMVCDREGDAQGAGALLLGGRRERRDADRRHGAGRRVGRRGRRRWRRARRST